MANQYKSLDVLNSEGPVILATREVGKDSIYFKFDGGGGLSLSTAEFHDFIYAGTSIENPFQARQRFVFLECSEGMRAPESKIQEFLQD
jgi:hypothetical protein